MRVKNSLLWLVVIVFIAGFLTQPAEARHSLPAANPRQSREVTAYDLIAAMNTLRMSYGLPALIEDSIINAVAQSTADTMAANNMSWHIGDVRGRLQAAGYGGGAQVWATENFAVGNMSIDEIMQVWSDSEHMRPAVIPSYCNVGAGVAMTADGQYYYILQAAYTSAKSCGEYKSVAGEPNTTGANPVAPVSQLIVPVKIATPDAEGKIFHVVEAGQSFWAIAIAYKITIHDIEVWNNLSKTSVLRPGQRLFIPSSTTAGYATPTPVGMIVPSTPDAEGKIFHTVAPYQALITIADAYKVTVNTLLALNHLQVDWPLQIGQVLMISPGRVTPSPTPRPLTPIEKLTPASDGNYYHVVRSGETLSWIAKLYNINLVDLMVWNGLYNDSIIKPEQKLVLQVTPPATATFTPGPPTVTATRTHTALPPTATRSPSPTLLAPAATAAPSTEAGGMPAEAVVGVALLAAGVVLFAVMRGKKGQG
jgi:LysM repeat protein